jgi:hypothetical protein
MNNMGLTEAETGEIILRAEGWNDQLRAQSAGRAEQAFELGCGLGLLPVVIVIVLLWVLGVITLILAVVLFVMGLLALAGIAALLANIARQSAARRTYTDSVEPEIVQFLSQRHISRQLFDNTASQSLPGDAPLQAFLAPLPPPLGETDTNQRRENV